MSPSRPRPSPPGTTPRPDVEALLNPHNVVIVGATDKPGNWAQRCWRNLGRYGYRGAVYPLNPRREEVWGVRCYRSYAELPEPPDHLAVFVPAPFVEETLRQGAAAGARSATVVSAGFEESPDPAAVERGRRLSAAVAELGIAVSGPNCLGNFNGRARFVTMTDNRPQPTEAGPVAVVGQSGGLVSLPHPFDRFRGEVITRAGIEDVLPYTDIVEVFNSRNNMDADNRRAYEFAREHNLLVSGVSDAHTAIELGRTYVIMPEFDGTPEGFKESLAQGEIQARKMSPLIHVVTSLTKVRKKVFR